jgi:hypothetical protein
MGHHSTLLNDQAFVKHTHLNKKPLKDLSFKGFKILLNSFI